MTRVQAKLDQQWIQQGRSLSTHINNNNSSQATASDTILTNHQSLRTTHNKNETINKRRLSSKKVGKGTSAQNKSFNQGSLDAGQVKSATNENHWGDPMQTKEKGIFRIACRNIKSIPMNQSNTRNEELILDIQKGEFDIIGLSEVNVAWQNIESENQLKER
jgi:hypothetical protein